MEILQYLWVEKYRPKRVEDMILDSSYHYQFETFIQKKDIPHLLFYGGPGVGKTTLARILINNILSNRDNVLIINGSTQSTRGIGFVDKILIPFLTNVVVGEDQIKIVFIDEADKLTIDAFDSLRGILEKFSSKNRFIFTCNYLGKIPQPIQSRFGCGIYKFEKVSEELILKKMEEILQREGVVYNLEDISFVIKQLYPDIRRIIGTLQRKSYTGELKVDKDEYLDTMKYIVCLILEIIHNTIKNNRSEINKNINKILEILTTDTSIVYEELYETLFRSNLPANVKIIINKYSNSHISSLIPHMNFIAMVYDIVMVIHKYEHIKNK